MNRKKRRGNTMKRLRKKCMREKKLKEIGKKKEKERENVDEVDEEVQVDETKEE